MVAGEVDKAAIKDDVGGLGLSILAVLNPMEPEAVSDKSWIAAAKLGPTYSGIFTAYSALTISELHNEVVCVKRNRSPKDQAKELSMLSACNNRRHAHIIKLLAVLNEPTTAYLVFPLAHMNLQQYWSGVRPSFDAEFWLLQQVAGLASAINAIHNELLIQGKAVFGLHGDIKATNILVFGYLDDHPTLKLADFGMSTMCPDQGSSRAIAPQGLTGTYDPPEVLLEMPVSQLSDMWRLGCVILEFIVWLLEPPQALNAFSESRVRNDYGFGFEFTNDYFFELSRPAEVDVKHAKSVLTIMQINTGVVDRIAKLRNMSPSGRLLALLSLVEGNLLKVVSDQRMDSRLVATKTMQILSDYAAEPSK